MSTTTSVTAQLLKPTILALIMVLAFSERLYSVLRFESIIHEFDPYFNFRATKYMVNEGIYNFLNWFDEQAWYPLGRIVGGTVYPGIMMTAAFAHWILHAINVTIKIRNICVFTAPVFSAFTAFATYLFTSELRSQSAGLFAAAMIAIVPGYISRSVAGSFDNEGVAIFALIFTYWLWLKASNEGSLMWASFCALSYFYMVAAWGGYVFIINLVPLHVLALLVLGRYSHRIYVAYSSFYVMGTLMAMQVHFVGFQAVQSSEHMGSHIVFALLQLYAGVNWVRSFFTPDQFKQFLRSAAMFVGGALLAAMIAATLTGYVAPWTGRFYSLMDPTYASKHIPIIASVSEHQPTTWGSYVFDLHWILMLAPSGMYLLSFNMTDASVFALIYAVTTIYFSGVMVRLMLVLTPIMVVLAAVGVSSLLETWMPFIDGKDDTATLSASSASASSSSSSSSSAAAPAKRDRDSPASKSRTMALCVTALVTLFSIFFVQHSTWATSEAYSSPSIILASKNGDGTRKIFDDFRESYRWINQNTASDARIMSWWDYGYQLAAMSNRTVLVDNNTWNNTHIAQVGKAFASNEDAAYSIMRQLDVDYVLVWFGGMAGYQSDDINKFLWMVRIAGSCDPKIVEKDYFTRKGEYSMGADGAPAMLQSLMYKLSYYRFGEVYTEYSKPSGFDRVRQVEIGNKDIKLTYLEEAYTSEHWLVRIYRVLHPPRDVSLPVTVAAAPSTTTKATMMEI